MNFNKWTYWLSLLSSISLLIAPAVFPVCPVGSKPMRCFFAFQAEYLFALLAVVIALSLFFTKEIEAKSFSGFLLFLIAIIIFILPFSWVIGICAHDDSPCHLTAALTRGLSVLLAFLGALIVWLQNKEIRQ